MLEINDALHGYIRVPSYVQKVLDTPLMQRLKYVLQCGTVNQVFISATHSRFAHSLGAMHLARLYVEMLQLDENDIIVRAFVLASLLHDIGHGPLSHVFERAIIGTGIHDVYKDHDVWRHVLLRENPELSSACGPEMVGYITDIWDGKIINFYTLLSGQAGVDRLDYLLRDTMFTNPVTSLRPTCVQRIMSNTFIVDGRVHYNSKARETIDTLLATRWYLYKNVYTHKTVHAADVLVLKLFRDPAALASIQQFMDPVNFVRFHDATLLVKMDDFTDRRLPKMRHEVRVPEPCAEYDADPECFRIVIRYDDAPGSLTEYIYRWFDF